MNKRRIFKRIGWSLLAIVIVLCIGFVVWYKVNEKRFLYSANAESVVPEDSLRLQYEEVSIESSDGAKLVCGVFPAQRADTTSAWILYLHGNGGVDLGDIARCKIFHDLGLNVLAVQYRGFGKSTGKPSETGLYADAAASHNFLRTVKGVAPTSIVLYGHSMGSAIATELACRVPAAGIALEGAFTSMVAVYGVHYRYIPWSLLNGERYESIERISGITIPKIFIHAIDDEAVPISQAQELFAKAVEPKTFLEIKGGHNHAPTADREKYVAGLSQFFQKVFHR